MFTRNMLFIIVNTMLLENIEFEEYNCILGVYSYKSIKFDRMTPFKYLNIVLVTRNITNYCLIAHC